ncbi:MULTISPECIES: hypothetical protein [unclassified Frondihabitans]|uniref:hypothetical protein n=1 Tax=unclassified Frondihabitans TaxID=2626248 RepID=UPI000F4DC702|nr:MULTISPECIES: hypothetical protein [unclassified Frondihabitans]
MELLPIEWVTIADDGVHLWNRTYRGEGLIPWRKRKSNHHQHDGKWPVYVNSVRPETIFFRDPETGVIHEAHQTGAIDYDAPRAIETAIASVNVPENRVKRLSKSKRKRKIGRAIQGIVDRTDASLGISDWKARIEERAKGHRDIFHITLPNDVEPASPGAERVASVSPADVWGDDQTVASTESEGEFL